MTPVFLSHYFNLGLILQELPQLRGKGYDEVSTSCLDLVETLSELGYRTESERVFRFVKDLHEAKEANPEAVLKQIPRDLSTAMAALIEDISSWAQSEFPGKRTLILADTTVTEALANMQSTLNNEQEKIILADTLRCLEAGAYRAVIVMAWNLAYERLRHWIFISPRKRLKKFNTTLVARNKTVIKNYEDFYVYGEHFVIETAYAVPLFTKHHHQVLLNALTDRNHFAHPTSRQATSATATGYVENLIVNILNHPDFKVSK
jgi:hypothetical protein